MSRNGYIKLDLHGLKNPESTGKAAVALWSALVATLLQREMLTREDIEYLSEEARRLASSAFEQDEGTRQVVERIVAALVASAREGIPEKIDRVSR